MTATATIMFVSKRAYGTGSLYERNGDWFLRWRDQTGRHAKKLGPVRAGGSSDGLTKREAQGEARKVLLGAETNAARPTDLFTVKELGAVHKTNLERHGRKPSHIRSTGYHLSKHIDPALGDMDASTVDESDVRRLIDRMLTNGLSPKMVRNVAGTLHSVLELAVQRRLLDRNPCTYVQLPKVQPTAELHFLAGHEVIQLLAATPPAEPGPDDDPVTQRERDQWPITRLLILTAVSSGLRLGELRGLRWQDLDFGAMKIRVRHSYVRGNLASPKSRSSIRAVPLSSDLFAELEQHHKATPWNQDDDYVLGHPHTGLPLSETRLREHYAAALKRANVRPVRIHDLRHTFATTVAASGEVSLRTLQAWMGHESAQTTEIYAAYMPSHREQEQLDSALGGQFGGQLRQNRPVEYQVGPDDS